MILHEIPKLLHRRLTVLLMGLLFLISVLVVWNLQLPGTTPYLNMELQHILSLYKALPEDGEQALAALEQKEEQLHHAIYEEADPGALLTGDIYSDRILLQTLIKRIEPIVSYTNILDGIDENAETLLLTGRYESGSFSHKNILQSRKAYEGLRDVTPKILYSGAVELLPGGGITELMQVFLSLLLALELIFSEREGGTLALCKPACKGGLSLIIGKLFAGLLVGGLGTLALYGSNFLVGLLRCGTVDLSAPVQSVYSMIRCPWQLSIGEYICLFIGLKLLWTAALTALAYAAAYIGRNLWQCCSLFLLLSAACFLRPHSVLNPLSDGKTTELFATYWNLNVFGQPVSSLAANALGMMIVSLVAFGGSVVLHLKKEPKIPHKDRKGRKCRIPFSLSLFRHEAWKLLILQGGIWILLALIPMQFLLYWDFPDYIPPQEQLYIQYSQILSGKATREKDDYIQQEEARFAQLYTNLEEYGQGLREGRLSRESYDALSAGITRKLESEGVFHRARDQYQSMKAADLDYVCLSPYNRLLGAEGKKELLRQGSCLIVALSLGLSGILATEHETGMILLLRTSEREVQSHRRRKLLAVLYGLTAGMVVFTPQVVSVVSVYGMDGLTATADSVPLLGLGIGRVWTVLGLYALLLAAAVVGLSLLILKISALTKKTIHSCLFSAAFFLPPLLLALLFL